MLKKTLLIILIFGLFASCKKDVSPDLTFNDITPPTNFKASVLGPHSIKLTWTKSTDNNVKYIKIFRSTTGHPNTPEDAASIEIYKGTAQTYTDDGLATGQRYYYSIFAYASSTKLSIRKSHNGIPYDLDKVRDLTAIKALKTTTLNWVVPIDLNYVGFRVQVDITDFPANYNDGTTIHEGPTTSVVHDASSALVLNCINTYKYSVFAYVLNGTDKIYSDKYVKIDAKAWCDGEVGVDITYTSPETDSYHNGNVNLSISVSPFECTVSQVKFFLKNEVLETAICTVTDNDPNYSCIWDSTTVSEGPHTITVEVTNSSATKNTKDISVTIDRTKPDITVSKPLEPSEFVYEGNVDFFASVTDVQAVSHVELIDNNGITKNTSYESDYKFSLNIRNMFNKDAEEIPDGTYTFTVTAYDKAGNFRSINKTFEVNNAPFITEKVPSDLYENFSINGDIIMYFSEDMLASTININNIKLKCNNIDINGSVSYNSSEKKAIFNPDVDLPINTNCVAEVTKNVKDNQDPSYKNMPGIETWSFTTNACASIFGSVNFDDANCPFVE